MKDKYKIIICFIALIFLFSIGIMISTIDNNYISCFKYTFKDNSSMILCHDYNNVMLDNPIIWIILLIISIICLILCFYPNKKNNNNNNENK